MTREEKIVLLESRINRLAQSNKNIKCGGVLRALRRELRNLKNS